MNLHPANPVRLELQLPSGEAANWLERRMLEHANPLHYSMALAATAGFVYGL